MQGRTLAAAAALAALSFAPGFAPYARAQAIEQGSLAELDPWAVGALMRGETAPPRTLWRQSDANGLALLFDRVPAAAGSPAALRLFRLVLLAPSEGPQGDTLIAARKRYEALARMGAGDEIVAMVSGSGEAKRDAGIALYATQADLGRGRLRDACRRVDTIQTDAPTPFILRLRALCFADAGEKESADLALDVARTAGGADPALTWFQGALAIVNGATPARPPMGRYDTSLNAAVSTAAKLRPPPQNALINASTFALAIVARDENTPGPLRAQAAQKALRLGVIAPDVARSAGRADAASRTPTALGQAMKEVDAATSPYAQALAIEAALKRARPHGEFAGMARLFAADIARLPVDPGTAPAAITFARAMLAVGDVRSAQTWRQLADTVSADASVLAILDAALTIARNDAASARFAADRRIETAAPAAAGLVVRDLQALDALGFPLGANGPGFVQRTAPAPGRKPDPALMSQLTTAAQRGAVGETAIYAGLALGDGAEQLDGAALAQVLVALRTVGLGDAARAVAVEALIGGQAR